jgi:pectin methylesterase-like acyl-CoA thioesterase
MRNNTIAAMLCAALSIPLSIHARAATVAACPGGAGWCDDFEHGAARWIAGGGAAPKAGTESGTSNHLLQAGDGAPLLVAGAETAGLTQAGYFVEARLRPSPAAPAPNSRRAILLARYVDERNWIGAAIGFTPGSKRLALELAAMVDGKLNRLKQVGRSTEGGAAGEGFQTLRLELGITLLSVYLNGELITTAPAAFAPGGQAGVLAQGGAIDVDDVRIGAASVRPGRIALARMTSRITLQAGDAPQRLAVSAFAGDAVTALPFSASSNDPSVASATVDNGALQVSGHRQGAAIITLASPLDANVATSFAVTVGAGFAAPMQATVPPGRLAPQPRDSGVAVDTRLHIRFDSAPVLGADGSVRIFRTRDNALVDVIRPHDEVNTLGYIGQQWKRVVSTRLITIDGPNVTIAPHNERLAYGTEYYVAIDARVFEGATVEGRPFAGLGRGAGWRFRTRAAVPARHTRHTRHTVTVDDDGPADFRTVQGALNHAMRTLPRAAPVTIRIANGHYEELLYLRGKDRVTLRGESRNGVVIHATNNDGINPGSGLGQMALSPSATGGRSLLLVEDADLLTLDTLTLKNTSLRVTSTGAQAEALYFNSAEGRLVAVNANFLSEQDTIQVKGYSWFYRTLIAGNVDFIWGYNHAALFEESEIRSVGDSASHESGGYVVQARTVAANDPGFVFLNSRLTHGKGPGPAANDVPPGATWLARSPGTASTWDNVSYINCRIDNHVNPLGWAGAGVQRQPAPNPATASSESGWTEYGSMDLAGQPLDLSTRVGGFLLTANQAKQRFGSRARLFQGFDGGRGWRPALPRPNKQHRINNK